MLRPEKVSETEMNNTWFFIYWKDFDSDVQDDTQNTWMVFNCSGTSKWKTQVVYLMWLGNRRWIVVYLTLIAHVFSVYMETLVVLYVKWLTLEIQSAFHKTNKHNKIFPTENCLHTSEYISIKIQCWIFYEEFLHLVELKIRSDSWKSWWRQKKKVKSRFLLVCLGYPITIESHCERNHI